MSRVWLAGFVGLTGLVVGCGGEGKEQAVGAEADVKESTVEHCDGEDNDGDGTIDEDCAHCDYLVTRPRAYWGAVDACVLTGGATGYTLLPQTVGTVAMGSPVGVQGFINRSAGSNVNLRLGQQILIARLNVAAFGVGDVPYHDWDHDGADETVQELIDIANALYIAGASTPRSTMANILTSVNADGQTFGSWFDDTCAAPAELCNGVDDDGDGTVDEDCGCYEACDGYDNDGNGTVDDGCGGSPPVVDSIDVGPTPLYTDTDAVATAVTSDPDGDAVTTRFQWYVNNLPVGGATTDTLSSSSFSKGSVVRVAVWASDGTTETGPEMSATVTVANSAPTAPSVALTAVTETSGYDGRRCDVATAATDIDGDAISYTFAWTVDGAAYADAGTSVNTGDYVYARELGRGSEWSCTVTASDGSGSAEGSASEVFNGPAEAGYAFETVAYLDFPSDMVVLDDGSLLISDLLGGMHRIDPDTGTELASANPLDTDQELLAFALHPDFGDGAHDWIYLWGSRWGDMFRFDFDLDTFTFSNETVVVNLDAPSATGHCGGGMIFWDGEGGEDHLYVGTGPINGADAQAGDNPGKKLLAFSVDPTTGDLTGAGLDPTASDDRVAAYGTRNPWRLTDCGAALCFGDPGVSSYEEINLYTSAGQNFGHPDQEGPVEDPYEPAATYWSDHEETFTNADPDGSTRELFSNVPSVSHRFTGSGYGGRLTGWIFYGDFYDGWVRALEIDDSGAAVGDSIPVAHQNYITKYVETADGTVYIIELGGSLKRMVHRADRPTVGPVGQALSSTEWASSDTVDFTPQYVLWSNGADKLRHVWLPEGTTIDNTDENEWVWPDGARIYKDFELDGALLETRVLAREDGRWIPGVYLWNADQSEAYLSEGYSTALSATSSSGENYIVPSTELCNECHESERGREWPLATTPYRLGDTALTALTPLLLNAPSAAPTVSGSANTQAVRGWLDVNCAFCHNPEGVVSKMTVIEFDLSYDATIDTSVIAQYYHASPNLADGDPIFNVASPRDSVLYQVIRNEEMPPIAVWEHPRTMMSSISNWIAAGAP